MNLTYVFLFCQSLLLNELSLLNTYHLHDLSTFNSILQSKYHDNESWYYGKLNRKEAEELLQKHKHMGDGTFLVRESESKNAGFAIDFL